MTITDIRLLGPASPYFVLVEIEFESGVVGIGMGETHAGAARAIIQHEPRSLRTFLLGQSAASAGDIERLWDAMLHLWGAQGGPVVNAMAALDMALWDALGKARGVPAHELLGGAIQSRVPVYASATAFLATGDPADPWRRKPAAHLIDECREYAGLGFSAVKIGWGNHFDAEGRATLRAVREAIGPQLKLMLDFGIPAYWTPGWNAARALEVARVCGEFDIGFLEEPLPPHADLEYAQLTAESPVRIATGEMLCLPHEFETLIQRRAVSVIQPDAMRIGITQCARVARLAAEHGVACVPHSPWSALAVASHVHVLSTVTSGEMTEYPSPRLFTDEGLWGRIAQLTNRALVEHPPTMQDGALPLPTRAGLGVGAFVPAAIAEMEALTQEHAHG